MSNNNNKKDSNIVIKDAITLKQFFNKYYDTPEKKELLKYIPIAVNYTYDPYKRIAWAETLFGFGKPSFNKALYPLSFQITLRFSYDCKIKISKEYNEKLIDFSKRTKTNETIIREYYEKNLQTLE